MRDEEKPSASLYFLQVRFRPGLVCFASRDLVSPHPSPSSLLPRGADAFVEDCIARSARGAGPVCPDGLTSASSRPPDAEGGGRAQTAARRSAGIGKRRGAMAFLDA